MNISLIDDYEIDYNYTESEFRETCEVLQKKAKNATEYLRKGGHNIYSIQDFEKITLKEISILTHNIQRY